MGIRFGILISFFVLGYSILLYNLYELQLAHGAYYQAKIASQELASSFLDAKRGAIYFTDKRGERLAVAVNKDFPVIYAVPNDIDDPEEVGNRLAPVLGEDVASLVKKLSKKDDKYELLGEKVDSELARRVDELKIRGIYVITEPRRFYPVNSMAAHLLGFVGPRSDGAGRAGHYGLEELYEEQLAGVPGEFKNSKMVSPEAGKDLVLTIDPTVQFEAERILENLVKTYEAKGGAVIVEEPETGKILALAGQPNFDPNRYSNSDIKNFLNPAIQQIYEPGSVFKVVTMAAGIDSGKITPETTFFDKGIFTMNGRTIKNHDYETVGPRGLSTMSNILEHSLNTGAVFVERTMGRAIFRDYVDKFGFGEKTGIGLPGELAGDIRRLSPKEKDIAFATASYGQGVAVTPIELVNAFSAIANGGTLMRPYLDASLEPKVIRPVISEDTARKVTAMMVSAVDKAKVAKIESYRIAGKTGTAFVPDFENGGYTENLVNTYIGFAPASEPKFVILIKLDEPAGGQLAGMTVVPPFRDLAQFILNYYNIPPDRLGGALQ